jgi:DNA-directed RNA polymerase specialized sigma24 family protein
MADSPQSQPGWLANHAKLTAVAFNLFRQERLLGGAEVEPVMKGLGRSPLDFASDAMTEFYENRQKYRVRSDDEAFAVMVTILKRDFIDACKSHAYRTAENDPEEHLPTVSSRGSDPLSSIEADDLAKKFHPYAKGEQELTDVIDAAAYLAVEQTEPLKRDDIANLLGITRDELTKRNKRLKYNFHANDPR